MADIDLEALRGQLEDRLQPGENMDDVLAATLHLAERRAEELGREPQQADLEFAASILCWYPFKTPPPQHVEQELKGIRSEIVRDAAKGQTTALDQVIPDRTVAANLEQLETWQQEGVKQFLTSEQ